MPEPEDKPGKVVDLKKQPAKKTAAKKTTEKAAAKKTAIVVAFPVPRGRCYVFNEARRRQAS
jgi:hypothetical protein